MKQIFHECKEEVFLVYIGDLLNFGKDLESQHNRFQVEIQQLLDLRCMRPERASLSWKEKLTLLLWSLVKMAVRWILKLWCLAGLQNLNLLLTNGIFLGNFNPFDVSFQSLKRPQLHWLTSQSKVSEVHIWNDSCDRAFKSPKTGAGQTNTIIISPDLENHLKDIFVPKISQLEAHHPSWMWMERI